LARGSSHARFKYKKHQNTKMSMWSCIMVWHCHQHKMVSISS
jgi:hypothetical protein